MATLQFRLRKVAGGWEGNICLPNGITKVQTSAVAPTKAKALERAAALAESVLDNPVVQAVLPPQAAIALRGVRRVAEVAKLGRGALKKLNSVLKPASKFKSLIKKLW